MSTDVQAQHPLMLRGIVSRLEGQYGDHFSHDTLEHYVGSSYRDLAARSKVLNHIPAFVERYAKQRLRDLARHGGPVTGHPPVVMFVCARDDGASQMAAALFAQLAGDRAVALAAGSETAGPVRVEVVRAMDEIGIALTAQRPHALTTEIQAAADVIVTIDHHDRVDLFDDTEYVAWRLPGLDGDGIDDVRSLRDELCRRVADLYREVVPPAAPAVRASFDRDLDSLATGLAEMERLAQDLLASAAATLDARTSIEPDATAQAGGVAETAEVADDAIDGLCLDVERSVVDMIARRQPVAVDLRRLIASYEVALHLERIADGAVELAAVLAGGTGAIDARTRANLSSMRGLVAGMLTEAMAAFRGADSAAAWQVASLDGAVDDLHRRTVEHLLALSGTHDLQTLMLIDRSSRLLERAADHTVDIAECALFLATGELCELNGPDRRIRRDGAVQAGRKPIAS